MRKHRGELGVTQRAAEREQTTQDPGGHHCSGASCKPGNSRSRFVDTRADNNADNDARGIEHIKLLTRGVVRFRQAEIRKLKLLNSPDRQSGL